MLQCLHPRTVKVLPRTPIYLNIQISPKELTLLFSCVGINSKLFLERSQCSYIMAKFVMIFLVKGLFDEFFTNVKVILAFLF